MESFHFNLERFDLPPLIRQFNTNNLSIFDSPVHTYQRSVHINLLSSIHELPMPIVFIFQRFYTGVYTGLPIRMLPAQ